MIKIAKGLLERRGVLLPYFATPIFGTEEKITEGERRLNIKGNNLIIRRIKEAGY